MGGTKRKGHVGQMNPSLFIFTTNSHLPLWPVNSGKPGSKSVEFILPLPVKSRHLLYRTNHNLLRGNVSYSECYYYAGKRSDRWRIFEIRVCMSFPFFLFFKSKRHVNEEVRSKCQFKFSVILSLEIHCIIDLNNVKSNHSINYYFE